MLIFSPVSAAREVQYDDAEPEVPLSNSWVSSVYPTENLTPSISGGGGGSPLDLGYEEYWPAPGDSWGSMPDVLMFTVSPAAPKLYWIVGTADYYTGSGWAKTTDSSQVSSFPQRAESVAYTLEVDFTTTNSQISLLVPQHRTNLTSMNLDPMTGKPSLYLDETADIYGIEVPGLQGSVRITYKATYASTKVNPSLINMENVPDDIRQRYLQLPDNLPQEVRNLAESLKNPSLSTMDQILADIAYLKSHFLYDTGAVIGVEAGVTNLEAAGDAGNWFNTATTISLGTGTGHLSSSDRNDYFKIYVTSGAQLGVTLTPPSGSDFDLYLYNSNMYQVDSSVQGGSSTDTVSHTATSTGYYYINVYQFSGSGTYTLQVSTTTAPAPTPIAEDWILSFIQRGKGTCMDFSTALAIILRLQNIPSRVNFGFKPGPIVGDKVLYFSSRGHSETEVYLPPYGWVRFDATPPAPTSGGGAEGDIDRDGMPDSWETIYGLNPYSNDANQDADGDGYTNLQEYQGMSNPNNASSNPGTDTDGDGMPNTWENYYGLNQNYANDANLDSDGDGYTNLQEYQQGTNPNDATSYPGSEDTVNPAITENQIQPPENQPSWIATYLTLTISPENGTRLQAPTVSFTMYLRTAAAPLAYKQVQLRDGLTNEIISTLTTNSSGYAYVSRTFGVSDPLGDHYITASFAGDETYASSSDTEIFLLYSPTTLTLNLLSSSVKRGEQLRFEGKLKDDLGAGVSGKNITVMLDGQPVAGSSVSTGVGGKCQGYLAAGADLSLGYHQLHTKFDPVGHGYLTSQSIPQTFQVLESAEGVTPPENTQISTQENVAVAVATRADQTLLYLGVAIAAAIAVAIAAFKLMPRGKAKPAAKAPQLPRPADFRKLLADFRGSEKYREGLIAAYKRFTEMLAEAEIYPIKGNHTARELSIGLSSKLRSFVRGDFDEFVTTYEKAMFTDRTIAKTEYDSAAEKFLSSIKNIRVSED